MTAVEPGDTPVTSAVNACRGETVRTTLPVNKGTLRPIRGRDQANKPVEITPPQARQDFGPDCFATFNVARDSAASRFDPTSACTLEIVTTKGEQGLSAEVQRVRDCDGVALETSIVMPPPAGRPMPARRGDRNEANEYTSVDLIDRLTAQSIYTAPRRDARMVAWDILTIPLWINYLDAQFQYDGSTVGLYWRQDGEIPYTYMWTIPYASAGHYAESSFSYLLYNYVHFHSFGFPTPAQPDVEAWSQPSIRGYGSGYVACSYWESWTGLQYYPGVRTYYYCYDW